MGTLKQFNRDIRWNTRIFVLATVATVVLSVLLNAWNTNFALTMLMVLSVILIVEIIAISTHRHPKLWLAIWWILILLLLALVLSGSVL